MKVFPKSKYGGKGLTHHNLLAQLTLFVGRQAELSVLYHTANSHWFSEIITPDITTAAALSAEQRSAAEERGRAQDLWEVAAKLAESKLPAR